MEIEKTDHLVIGRMALFKDRVIEKCIENKNTVIVIFVSVLLGLFFIFGFTKKFQGSSQKDYLVADMAFERWSSEGKQSPELLSQLEKTLKKHPHLHSKFDAVIGQQLLFQNEGEKALNYLGPTLQRVQGASPYHKDFAAASFLIAKGELKEALVKAKELRGRMAADLGFWEKQNSKVRFGALLYAYNLMRIAALEKEAGTPQDELAALLEIERNLGLAAIDPSATPEGEKYGDSLAARKICDPEAYAMLQNSFKEQRVSLQDYIKHRKAQLAAK